MQVNIELLIGTVTILKVLVALLIQRVGGFAMGLTHSFVLGLPAKGQRFGGAGIIAVPCLCGAGEILARPSGGARA